MVLALLKLLTAHVLGDFFLQPNSWVTNKEKKKLKSEKLYLHIALHIILIFVLFWSLTVWKIALIIGVAHGIIDALKLIFQKPQTKRIWFFADQFLHVAVIAICWQYNYHSSINLAYFLQSEQLWLFLLGAIFLTTPAAMFIRVIIAKWIPNKASTSLQDAGKFIGILERLLIYLFVCTNHFEAVGFLLAAKSIFRFGDLKEAHDIKLTEYVLIGTLLSFGMALIVALIINKIIG